MQGIFQKRRRAFLKRKPFIHFCGQFARDILDFIFPPICTGCDGRHVGTHLICESCLRDLAESMAVSVQKDKKDFQHLIGKKYFDGIITCWGYTPLLEHLIDHFKYQRGKKTGRFLGTAAAESICDRFHMVKNSILVPVPLHRVRCRERGFNQSDILCRSMSSVLSLPVEKRILIRIKKTLTQTKLSADQRHHNVTDAFRVRDAENLRGKQIFLVDDVVTTGSTMNSCAETLIQAGAEKVIGLALSRPVLH